MSKLFKVRVRIATTYEVEIPVVALSAEAARSYADSTNEYEGHSDPINETTKWETVAVDRIEFPADSSWPADFDCWYDETVDELESVHLGDDEFKAAYAFYFDDLSNMAHETAEDWDAINDARGKALHKFNSLALLPAKSRELLLEERARVDRRSSTAEPLPEPVRLIDEMLEELDRYERAKRVR